LLGKHWPNIYNTASFHNPLDRSLAQDIGRHLVKEDDWTNSDVLEQVGFLSCSQAKLFGFVEDVLHPIHRGDEEQENLVANLNPILKRDGYTLARAGAVSGYPVYQVVSANLPDTGPADNLISETLSSFDESGVHAAWEKALGRRSDYPAPRFERA